MGSGRDTEVVIAFLPSMLSVRAGDTVTWKLNADEIHTVSFLSGAPTPRFERPIPDAGPTDFMLNPQAAFPTRAPGAPVETCSGTGFAISGTMSDVPPAPGAPPNNEFSLIFDTPGTYDFVCIIHPFQIGTIEVLASNAQDVPSQADIDAQAEAQLAPLLVELEQIKQSSPIAVTQEAGPNGTTIWHEQAGTRGLSNFTEVFEFLAKDITIQEGDTVVWTSPTFHTVTFHPGQDAPEFVVPEPQDAGPPLLRINPAVLFPVKPASEFNGTGYWNSGTIGLAAPFGTNFSMTFSQTGSFDYICALHVSMGMEGSVTVVERQAPHTALLDANLFEYPEGLAIDGEGNIYAGMAPAGEIKKITPSGDVATYAQLPAPGAGFLVGMDFDAAGDLYAAMSSFDPETHGIWKISDDGATTELFASLPVAGFPNVLAFNSDGEMFVTDTIGGGIWQVDSQGNVSTWAMDESMIGAIPPGPLGFPIGANGLAFDEGKTYVYVSVTDKSRIVRILVEEDGSAGDVEVFVEDTANLGGPDGLTFGPSGTLYVALFGSDGVAMVSPSGEISPIVSGGRLQNPSDVKFGIGDDSNTLYIANFAAARLLGLVPGTPLPGVLMTHIATPKGSTNGC